jgi:hypothetical protein
MKKNIFLLAFIFTSFIIGAQVVTPVQTTLITKITADWCPNCGTWGWNFTNQLKDKVANTDAILWNVHYSGGLRTPTALAIANNFNFVYQPQFFLDTDSEDLGVTSGNVASKVSLALEAIKLNSSSGTFVGMGTTANIDASKKVTVNCKVKFFETFETGEYYLAAYLVKKNLVWNQASIGNSAVHHSILDKSLSTDAFGKLIGTGPIAKDKEFSTSFTLDNLVYHNGKNQDTKIVTVLWRKKDNKYTYINAREVSIDLASSTKEELSAEFDFTPVLDGAGLNIELSQGANTAKVTMTDISGKQMKVNANFDGNKSIFISNENIVNGNYFISVTTENGKKTKQIYFGK